MRSVKIACQHDNSIPAPKILVIAFARQANTSCIMHQRVAYLLLRIFTPIIGQARTRPSRRLYSPTH